MNRREFLKAMLISTIGLAFNDVEAKRILETAEPMIYKRFLQFSEYEVRPKTELIVIHHAGKLDINNNPVDSDSSVEGIHKWHIEHNGWAGVGYHYLIRKDGRIEQGRLPNMIGAHAYGHNKNSIGICLAGNFDRGVGKPNRDPLQSLKELTAYLCSKYNINPSKQTIVGHRDLNSDTTCPGDNLYRKLGELRSYCKNNGW